MGGKRTDKTFLLKYIEFIRSHNTDPNKTGKISMPQELRGIINFIGNLEKCKKVKNCFGLVFFWLYYKRYANRNIKKTTTTNS